MRVKLTHFWTVLHKMDKRKTVKKLQQSIRIEWNVPYIFAQITHKSSILPEIHRKPSWNGLMDWRVSVKIEMPLKLYCQWFYDLTACSGSPVNHHDKIWHIFRGRKSPWNAFTVLFVDLYRASHLVACNVSENFLYDFRFASMCFFHHRVIGNVLFSLYFMKRSFVELLQN